MSQNINSSVAKHSSTRNNVLDLFRGLAVILVMFAHILLPSEYNSHLYIGKPNFLENVTKFLRTGGWIGVDLFFVLSGFLVSSLLFSEYKKHDNIKVKLFLIRRGFKIYPSFFIFLAVGLIFDYVVSYISGKYAIGHWDVSPMNYVYESLFVINYVGGYINHPILWAHTWSIDVEEHFYLLIALYFYFLIKYKMLSRKIFIRTMLCLFIFCFAARLINNIIYPQYNFYKDISETHLRIDGLFFGVFLSYFNQFEKNIILKIQSKKILILYLAIPILLINFYFSQENNYWISVYMLGINPVAWGLIMVSLLNSQNKFLNKRNLITKIGLNSYSIYLWHILINLFLIKILLHLGVKLYFITNWYSYFILYFLISIFLGIFLTKLIEAPFLKLRDKLV